MRILKYAVKNIVRNAFLSLSSIGVIALIVFFINILLFVNFATHTMIDNVNKRISLSVNLKASFTDTNSTVIEILSDLKSLSKDLEVKYVSSKDALEILKKRDPELVKVIENDKENPLPATIRIRNINLDQYEMIDKIIREHKMAIVYDEQKSKKSLVDYRAQFDKIQSLTKVLENIRVWVFAIIVFFVFTVFLVVYSIIWNFVFYYRDEIKITKLVWGNNAFVYGPFSLQGALYTSIASLASLLIFVYLMQILSTPLFDDPMFVWNFLAFTMMYFVIEIIGMFFIGLLSWFLSSIRFVSHT